MMPVLRLSGIDRAAGVSWLSVVNTSDEQKLTSFAAAVWFVAAMVT